MTFRLKITCDNAAFEGDQLTEEIARILARAAWAVTEGQQAGTLLDMNGNAVGTFALKGGR